MRSSEYARIQSIKPIEVLGKYEDESTSDRTPMVKLVVIRVISTERVKSYRIGLQSSQ